MRYLCFKKIYSMEQQGLLSLKVILFPFISVPQTLHYNKSTCCNTSFPWRESLLLHLNTHLLIYLFKFCNLSKSSSELTSPRRPSRTCPYLHHFSPIYYATLRAALWQFCVLPRAIHKIPWRRLLFLLAACCTLTSQT